MNMHCHRVLTLTAVVALGLALVCCRKSQDEKITATSTGSAIEPVVDEDYRIRITWPGKGWKLMGERDIRQLVPDAIAGTFSDQQTWGAVIVERFPGVELDALAQLVVGNMPLEDRVVEQEDRLLFQGKQARRVMLTGRVSDVSVRYVLILFAHQDHVYQLIGWGPQNALAPDGKAVQPFFDAFSLLEGEVTGRDEAVGITDASGPGWQLREGVFRSAVSRLRLAPPQGWRVAVGSELQQMNADAEVGLIARNPEIYIIVIAEQASSMDEQAFLRMTIENLRTNLGSGAVEGSVELAVAGETRAFTRLRSTSPSMEFLYSVLYRSGMSFQIMAWYPAGSDAEAALRVADGLAAIEILDDQAADELRRALEAEPDHQNAIGAGFALRRGLYRDFAGKWTWRKPAGFWRIQAGQGAREVNPDASLFAHEPARGVYVMAITEEVEEMDLASYTAVARGAMELGLDSRATEPRKLALGDVRALTFELEAATEPVSLRYRIATAIHGNTALQILVWGDAAHMKAQAAAIDAAIDGFRFVPALAATEEQARAFRDLRMGYSFDPGADGWQRKDETPAAIAGIATVVSWRKGSDVMMVMALHNPETHRDNAWFFDFLEQRVRDSFGKLASGEPTREDVTVAGTPGRRLTWKSLFSRLDAYLVRRDQTVYAIVGVGLDGDQAAALPSRFAFLD